MCVALIMSACASPSRTTRMDTSDFDAMAATMAQSLADSAALEQRGPGSEPWVVTVDKVTNLSDDVMTTAEQWAVMQRIIGSLDVQALRQQKNVSLVLPRGRADAVLIDGRTQLGGPGAPQPGAQLPGSMRTTPTHVMHATFRSLERSRADGRTDTYYCEFELFDVTGGQPVWTDRFEYKRQARGAVWD